MVFFLLATRATGEARDKYLKDALATVQGALAVFQESNAAYRLGQIEKLRAMILAEQTEPQVP